MTQGGFVKQCAKRDDCVVAYVVRIPMLRKRRLKRFDKFLATVAQHVEVTGFATR